MDSALHRSSCWSSYSQYGLSGFPGLSNSHFLLSVVLDANTWKFFSRIRIILIYRETEVLHGLVSISNSAFLQSRETRLTLRGLNYRLSKIVTIPREFGHFNLDALHFTGMSCCKNVKLYAMGKC